MRSNKGITLVALVITIIVLLILAGVSISLVVGDNGVLTQAQSASKKTDIASADNAIQLTMNSLSTKFMGENWVNNVNAKFYSTVKWSDVNTELQKNGYKLVGVDDENVPAVGSYTPSSTFTDGNLGTASGSSVWLVYTDKNATASDSTLYCTGFTLTDTGVTIATTNGATKVLPKS